MPRYFRILLWASIALNAQFALADSVSLGSLPNRPGKAGFTMGIEIESVGGNGYHPFYLQFNPLGKQYVRDRYLQVVLGPRDDYETELDFDLTCSVKLPEGGKLVRVPIYVPHYYPWDNLRVTIFEDGRKIETGSSTFHFSGIRERYANQATSVGIIEPRDQTQDAPWKRFPDVRTLVTVLGDGPIPEDANVPRLSHTKARILAADVQPAWVQFRLIGETALHDSWLGYSQLDVIIVAEPVLSRIEESSPEQFAQLKNWLAAGGNLWVYAAENPTSSLLAKGKTWKPSGRQMLDGKHVAGNLRLQQENDTSPLMYESWNGIQKRSQNYAYRSSNRTRDNRGVVFKKLKAAGHPFAKNVPVNELAAQLRFGTFGLGKILAIESEDPFPGSFQFWRSASLNLHQEAQLKWIQRNGIDVASGNDNYWMWLIESVGQPPVKSFVLLNTIFVVVIGPLCYVVFRRRGRLYLLYFFAPALAGLVTFALFAYALAADGTRTQARVRQVTWLDPRNGYAVEQSRQTYYAVFGGERGLEFPNDSAVYPVRNTPAQNRYYYRRGSSSSRDGQIELTSQSQRLAGLFLPPRNQVQYLVTQPREIAKSLEFQLAAESQTVTNHMDFAINQVLVRDKDNQFWSAGRVASGEVVTLKKEAKSDPAELLNLSVLPPLGEVPMLRNNRPSWGPNRTTGINVSMLEDKMDKWSRNLPRRSFVAVADFEGDQLGVADPVVVDSVHVLMGVLP